MTDEWKVCFDPKMGLSPNDFEQTWCRVCRNQECTRAKGSQTSWLQRISTQVDRLLINPKFADLSDPKFQDIRSVDFPSAVREAMRLEISDRKRDWTIPTEEEATQMAQEMVAKTLQPIESLPEKVPPEPPEKSPLEVIQKFSIRGTKGDDYDVSLVKGDKGPEWTCTCPAFQFGKARPCKHIEYAEGLLEEEAEAPVSPPEPALPATPPPLRFQTQVASTVPPRPPVKAPYFPPMENVPMPTGGMMVDGSKPSRVIIPTAPAVDPWAPPPTKPTVIPVGGKVVLGGKK